MAMHQGTDKIPQLMASLGKDDILAPVRRLAATRFASMDWPQASEEDWRKSRLAELPLDSLAFAGPVDAAKPVPAKPEATPWYAQAESGFLDDVEGCAEPALVVRGLDGHYTAQGDSDGPRVYSLTRGTDLSDGSPVPPDLAVRALEFYRREVEKAEHRLVCWNAAVHEEALLVHIPRNWASKAPVIVDHVYSAGEQARFPLVIILADRHSEAEVLHRYAGAAEGLVVMGTYSLLADDARLRNQVIQDLDSSAVFVGEEGALVARNSLFSGLSATLGSGLGRLRSRVDLLESGSEAYIEGIYLGTVDRNLDLLTVQNHLAPHTTSRALFKGVVRHEAHTRYRGMIHVAHGASKTDAYLTNNNMVLDDGARAESIPCLNIMTDDVKCSHGSTTGKLPDDQLFYLRTRGLDRTQARALLVNAFLAEVADRVSPCVRPWLLGQVSRLVADDQAPGA